MHSSTLSFISLSLAAVFVASSSASNAATVSLTPAAKAAQASGLSQVLSPSFAGFGIEPSNLYSFTGGSTVNQFSVNLLQNLANFSGEPCHLRIGGNTADYMIYDSSYNDYSLEKNPHSVGQGAYPSDGFIFGPSYWTALNRFPAGTPITFGLNLAYEESDYVDKIVKEASAAVQGLTNVKLASFEIGNEPDLYAQNGFRTGSWSGQEYTKEWLARASAVYDQVLKTKKISPQFFEPACTASTIGTSFEISDLSSDGITANANGTSTSYVASWNQHDYFYFVSVSTFPITLDYMMDLSNTYTQFAYWTHQVSAGLATGLPYNLREMASVGPIGMNGVTDTFGASLWTLNFFLYAASLNISSVEMHMTDNSNASAWQPIDMYGNGPHVRPNYYAWAATSQLIGSGNGTTQISTLPTKSLPSSYTGRVSAFAAYASGKLTAIVLINTQQANATDSAKGSLTFTLSLPSFKGQSLYLSYLTADGADSLHNTTWNGISFENSGDGTPTVVNNTADTVQIGSDGSATVTVRDSQALVANIGSQLGSNKVIAPTGTVSAEPIRTASSSSSSSSSNAKTSGGMPSAASPSSVALVSSAATAIANSATSAGSAKSSSATQKSQASGSRRFGSWTWSAKMAISIGLVGVAIGYAWR